MATSALQLPSITAAYTKRTLQPREGAAFQPDASINDRVTLWQGDITDLDVDGIQNAANAGLRGGGGIDGAIHRAAGPDLLKACRKLGGCKTGSTKITEGFDLQARYVLHTVGPIYDENEAELCDEELEGCYRTTLEIAKEHGLKTIALCGVSTGVYGFPLRDATEIALRTTRAFLEDNPQQFERIVFCNFGNRDVKMYAELAPLYFPPANEAIDRDADERTNDAEEDSEKVTVADS